MACESAHVGQGYEPVALHNAIRKQELKWLPLTTVADVNVSIQERKRQSGTSDLEDWQSNGTWVPGWRGQACSLHVTPALPLVLDVPSPPFWALGLT